MRKRRYRVAELLGRGGFGSVYKAEKLGEEGFSTIVAIKLLHAMGGGSNPHLEKARSDALRRLRDEARLLGLLKHRAIVQVYDLERLRGEWAIVMEYVDGIQLAELVELVRVPVRQALAIIEEVADALHTAYHFEPHGQALHLLHRDIKPSNVMLTQGGSIKVLDFGIARANFEARESHTAGFLIGTQSYMSPEHLDFDDETIQVAAASDIYGLGAVLFELLAHKPFGRASLEPLQHQDKVSKQLDAHILGRVPHGLYQLLERMLSFAPEVRPTAIELRTACEEIQTELPGESLRVWCERVVAPVLRTRAGPQPGRDPIIGTVLEEGEIPDNAHLDAHGRTVAAKPPPSTYDLGNTWGNDGGPAANAAAGAGAIVVDGERDGIAHSPVAIDSPIHNTASGSGPGGGGIGIDIEGEGHWEPRPGRPRQSEPDEASSRRLVLVGVGVGVLAVVAVGIWGLTMFIDSMEQPSGELQTPPAAVVDAEAGGEPEVDEPSEPAATPDAPPAPVAVSAPAPTPEPAEPEPVAEPEPEPEPVADPEPEPEPVAEPEATPEPEPPQPVDATSARLAAIAALQGGGEPDVAPEPEAEAEAEVAEPDGPAVADAAVEEPPPDATPDATHVPEPEEPPPPPAPGSYRVQGNAIEVYLKAGGKRIEPGTEIDAGRYDIWALFDRSPGASAIRVGVARIEPGATVTIDCDASMTLCRVL